MALIELRNITKSYRVDGEDLVVLNDINLEIHEGEFVAIMGPSGSGKSTLMQIMGLLDRPTSGSYFLSGRDISRLTDDEGAELRSRTIGFIFQMFNLLARTAAIDNVMLPMIYSGAPGRKARAREILTELGMGDRLDHRPNELSGGQQQRVAIARSLVNRPKILFADEPTGNLASDQAEDILRQLDLLNRSGITIIMVTHDPAIAAHAKRVFHIKDGIIISDETKESSGAPSEKTVGAAPAVPSAASETTAAAAAGVATVAVKAPASPPTRANPFRDAFGLLQLKEYALSALKAIGANKVRSFLSMFGILIGVASVVAMLALGKGAQKAVESRISSLGSNLLLIHPESPIIGGVRKATGSVSRLTLEDVKEISAAPHALHAEGNVAGSAQIVYGSKNVHTGITGATPLYAEMRNATPYFGRFFTDREDTEEDFVALLGQTVVNNLFGAKNPVGKTVKINRINFLVIGILPLRGSNGYRDQDDMILVPLKTAMRRLFGLVYLNTVYVECDGKDAIRQVTAEIKTLMRRRHHLPEYKKDDFSIRNMSDLQAALSDTAQTFTLLLGIVAAISLLVGGIGIMNIMLVSVSERTREIGLRKAIGAPRRAILIQFLIEAVLLSALGGILGIALGIGTSLIFSQVAGWAAIVTPNAVALVSAFSVAVGIVFGFWPARRASLLSPIEALRYE